MQKNSTLLAVCFVSGLLGGLMCSLFLWMIGNWGILSLLNVQMAPELTARWLYPRLVWGGLWAIPYFFSVSLSRARRHWVRKGLYFSLLPTLYMLFIVFPSHLGKGQAGLELGMLTPAVVIVTNLVWGFSTGVFTRIFWGR
ncbi:hypothetical protein [Geopsychrobacter electrodiphilus]|uniref:hypothetical protein n=1 Tax=Geopsychrobacter electrodiphilus TaxID=225196 RepID=UPI0003683C36|nr:hypothetical protein [Geopsychrobacter electrodiphilus]